MKIKINDFENFMKSQVLERESIKQDADAWDQYFSDVKDSKDEAGKDVSQGSNIPDWAKKGLSLDALKGKNADERWTWLTNRLNTVIKDKQSSKVEELKGQSLGGVPGYRILWKEDKTETGDQQDKNGNVYPIYFTEIYKGNPGTWIDKKNESGKPGAVLGKGYWGQNSRILKTQTSVSSGATGPAEGISGGILWIDEPEKVASRGGTGLGDLKLIDLFASTEMGKSVLTSIMGDPEMLKKLEKAGKINFTDSPATTDEIEKGFTSEQKEIQKKNLEKLKSMGQKASKPDFSLISSPADFRYKPSSLNLSWDDVKDSLENAGVDSKMNFDQWNVIGIRNSLSIKNQYANRFTDLIVLMSPSKDKKVKIYRATTTPGIGFAYVPFRNWWMASALQNTINPNGVAILQPGVYNYQIGNHNGYTALVPVSNVLVGRMDPIIEPKNLKFSTLNPSKKENGGGINIHKALDGDTPSIDSWSAGCQVFKNGKDFSDFISTIQKEASDQKTYKYALINSSDLGRRGADVA
jgi:hypothetical protein